MSVGFKLLTLFLRVFIAEVLLIKVYLSVAAITPAVVVVAAGTVKFYVALLVPSNLRLRNTPTTVVGVAKFPTILSKKYPLVVPLILLLVALILLVVDTMEWIEIIILID